MRGSDFQVMMALSKKEVSLSDGEAQGRTFIALSGAPQLFLTEVLTSSQIILLKFEV